MVSNPDIQAQPFKGRKLLVANRGEIAIRVLRAASELGMRTVAIYTYEDRYSLHRYKADEAYQIGPDDEPLKPYLDVEEIIALAKKQGVAAIHPGYGFLSENVNFARACLEAGIVWVGPHPDAMAQVGDKVAAKTLGKRIGVPLIEDNEVPLTDAAIARTEAERIGLPVILKAAAGGGGRGMRVIREIGEIEKNYTEARREAETAFGDGTIFLEKFVDRPKHIEVQLLGDKHGNLIHLYERDCSVQRRFQKVVEIAPAPTLSPETKQQLYQHSLAIGKAVGYDNAGTVEFLVDPDERVYFIEVNPRIQVEHTVTEEVTGIDIVRSQILIALGHAMLAPGIYINSQDEIRVNGYSIQCRITTEDAANNFQPDYGRIVHYRHAGGFNIRLDEGSSYPGVVVSPFFDSMLVKVTASGRTLKGACDRIHRALREFRIRGVQTNIPFLLNLLENKEFLAGKATVNFIQDHPELLEVVRPKDRGTRSLQYLAEVIVNGNPDVTVKYDGRTFREPVLPTCSRYAAIAAGTKTRLAAEGRDAFLTWLKGQNEVLLTDTTLRDAHQSLLATRVRTVDMLAVAESIARNHPEFFSLEVWGGATFDVALRFLHECPWDRLRSIREAVPNILLQMLFRGSNAVGYAAYPDNVAARFIERAAENGIDVFRIFDSLNWLDNMLPSIQAVRERTDRIAEVCICYTGDILDPARPKFSLNYYLDLAKRVEDAGAHILCIKDMAGLLKPYAAEKLITELRRTVDLPIHLHTHDTAGIQTAMYLKAVEAGVHVIDCAAASMSGLTSQPTLNGMVAALADHPRKSRLNLPKLNQYSNYWEDVRAMYYPFESGLVSGTAEVYEHEIPGGQYSNLRPQAESLGLGNQWETVKRNFRLVNQLLGDIVKVTPSSKVVGDMALWMTGQGLTADDVLQRGASLSFPESVRALLRGDIGQPDGGFPAALQKVVLKDEQPYTDRPNAHLPPFDFAAELPKFQERFGSDWTELDLLSWLMFPKVFEDYAVFWNEFGDISYLPTPAFFFGMQPEEEVLVEIGPGKTLIVKYLHCTRPDANGIRTVHFDLNGQQRNIEVLDKAVGATIHRNPKATGDKQVGAPLQGKLGRILVKEGQAVQPNTPLFVVEAMKMETTVLAPTGGTVAGVELKEGARVESGDLVVTIA